MPTPTPTDPCTCEACATTPCRYCGGPVTSEYDPDTGSWYFPQGGAHLFECVHTNPAGTWIVRTTQGGVTPPRVDERRYTSRERAREVAAQTRRDNRREWPCGALLDIVVTHQA